LTRPRLAGFQVSTEALRQNPGGLFSELDQIASMLLPAGAHTYTLQARRGGHPGFTAGGPRLPVAVPMAILVDGGTASSAEILAAAVGSRERGRLVGTQTKGATEFAIQVLLPGGAGLSVATARVITSGSVNLEGRGLSPDIPSELSVEDLDAGVDSALLLRLPVVQPFMIERVRASLDRQGGLAFWPQPWSGLSYKIFAVEAAARGLNPVAVLPLAIVARALRMFGLSGIVALAAWGFPKFCRAYWIYGLVAYGVVFGYMWVATQWIE
jgi:hypothetical protein